LLNNKDKEECILFIESALLPASLDHHVASVAVGSPDNSADGGYDLFVSTTIGYDQVALQADGEPLLVEIAVNQAEIRLDFAHCTPNWGRDHPELFFDEKNSLSFQNVSEKSVDGSLDLLRGTVSAQGKVSNQHISGGTQIVPQFVHSPLHLIRIGNWRKKITETMHPVQRYCGWRITHNDGAVRSGVLARLRVKRNWIDIKQIEATEDGALSKAIRNFMSVGNKRIDLFRRLVKDLVFMRLQKSISDEYATLSVAGLIVSQDNAVSVVIPPEAEQKISIPANLLMRFLTSKEGTEIDTYNQIMVSEKEKNRIEAKQFVPQASYTESLAAFCELAAIYSEDRKIDDYSALKRKFSENAISELSVLGIVRRRKGYYYFFNPFPGIDYVLAFESVVRSQSTIKKTIELLSENPTISHLEIGDEINRFLKRNWKDIPLLLQNPKVLV